MSSPGSPFDQAILRCESPGVITTFSGGNGCASANFTGTEAVVSEFPFRTEFWMYCTHIVLLSGLADERESRFGSTQGDTGTPASELKSAICDAETETAPV